MKEKSGMRKRLRPLIDEARLASGRPNNAPSVVQSLMGRIDDFDQEVIDYLIATGLNKEVRAVLSQFDPEPERAERRQIDLWPAPVRGLVEEIDRKAVFVPSIEDFVDLLPGAISSEEMREAGTYLISHGEDSIRRGNALLRLADLSAEAA